MLSELPVYPRGKTFVNRNAIVAITPFNGPGGVILASLNMSGGERIVINASIEDTSRALKLRLIKCQAYGNDVELLIRPEAVIAIADHPQNPCAILYMEAGRMVNVNGSAEQLHTVFAKTETVG